MKYKISKITISITGTEERRLNDIRLWAMDRGTDDLAILPFNYFINKQGSVQVGSNIKNGYIEIVLHGRENFTAKQMRALHELMQKIREKFDTSESLLKLFKIFKRSDFMEPPFEGLEIIWSDMKKGRERNLRSQKQKLPYIKRKMGVPYEKRGN